MSRFMNANVDGVLIGDWIYLPLVHTTRNYTLQITDTHRLMSSVYCSHHQPFPGNDFYRERSFIFPNSSPFVTAVHAELSSTDNSTNWAPVWRQFHINLPVFFSQADFQLKTELSRSPTSYFMSLCSTELLTSLTNN
jgi:hypothetical protein